jgi:uncharacterized protein YbjQ (UPF0145 family)
VYSVHVEAISALRSLVADFGAMFGNKSELITKKLDDAMRGAFQSLEAKVKESHPTAVGVVGIRTQLGEVSRDDANGLISIVITGTVVLPKSKGGKTRKRKGMRKV